MNYDGIDNGNKPTTAVFRTESEGVIIERRTADGHREGYPALCLPMWAIDILRSRPATKVVVQIRKNKKNKK